MSEAAPALQPDVVIASGVGRRFGSLQVLADLDLELRQGEVMGLIGPNGGGKSTLLLLLAGLVAPTSGSVLVDGLPAVQVAVDRRGTIGLITADPGLYPLLTGRENLAFFGALYGLSQAETEARAAPFLEQLGLAASLDRPVAAWSSGMRQKLSLARALLMSPRVLLLDEPTSNLDPLATQAIHEAVRSQADAGVAVAFATHDLHAAEGICDRVAVIRGTVIEVQALQGRRAPPAQGGLLELYRRHAEAP